MQYHPTEKFINNFSNFVSNLKVTFVEVENFEGPGSGPGASLLECSKFINDEFVLIPTDAYIDQEINNCWDSNWVGVSKLIAQDYIV